MSTNLVNATFCNGTFNSHSIYASCICELTASDLSSIKCGILNPLMEQAKHLIFNSYR